MAKKGPRLCAEARFGVSAGEGMRTTRRGVRRMSDLMDLDTAESDAQHKRGGFSRLVLSAYSSYPGVVLCQSG